MSNESIPITFYKLIVDRRNLYYYQLTFLFANGSFSNDCLAKEEAKDDRYS